MQNSVQTLHLDVKLINRHKCFVLMIEFLFAYKFYLNLMWPCMLACPILIRLTEDSSARYDFTYLLPNRCQSLTLT